MRRWIEKVSSILHDSNKHAYPDKDGDPIDLSEYALDEFNQIVKVDKEKDKQSVKLVFEKVEPFLSSPMAEIEEETERFNLGQATGNNVSTQQDVTH